MSAPVWPPIHAYAELPMHIPLRVTCCIINTTGPFAEITIVPEQLLCEWIIPPAKCLWLTLLFAGWILNPAYEVPLALQLAGSMWDDHLHVEQTVVGPSPIFLTGPPTVCRCDRAALQGQWHTLYATAMHAACSILDLRGFTEDTLDLEFCVYDSLVAHFELTASYTRQPVLNSHSRAKMTCVVADVLSCLKSSQLATTAGFQTKQPCSCRRAATHPLALLSFLLRS